MLVFSFFARQCKEALIVTNNDYAAAISWLDDQLQAIGMKKACVEYAWKSGQEALMRLAERMCAMKAHNFTARGAQC